MPIPTAVSWRPRPGRRAFGVPLFILLFGIATRAIASPEQDVAAAINQFGLELDRQLEPPDSNTCVSPYSVQTAFAMVYAGTAGKTRTEMATVFHYPADESSLHDGLRNLQRALEDAVDRGTPRFELFLAGREPGDTPMLFVANRLFGRDGARIRTPFLTLTRDQYGAPLETLDFRNHTEASRLRINAWVEERTRKQISDLIPSGGLRPDTELVLVNALYFKAPWALPFQPEQTRAEPFQLPGQGPIQVPTMNQEARFGYVHRDGYTAVTLPYSGRELQFVILLPDAPTALPDLERRLQADTLAACAHLPVQKLQLHLPKFHLQPASLSLKKSLRALGLQSAFDKSADLSRMFEDARPGKFRITQVFHKTFINLDERGTEAAAATGAIAGPVSGEGPATPIEVRIDRPFLFAIQHAPSTACLFLGRMTDPR